MHDIEQTMKETEEQIHQRSRALIRHSATDNDLLADYGFAIDSGYQGSYVDYLEWRLIQAEKANEVIEHFAQRDDRTLKERDTLKQMITGIQAILNGE